MTYLPRPGEDEFPEYRRQLASDFFPFLEGRVRGSKLGEMSASESTSPSRDAQEQMAEGTSRGGKPIQGLPSDEQQS